MPSMTREQWLSDAAGIIRSDIFREDGFEVPPIRVSVGFPSRNALSRRRRTIGQCWRASASADGIPQILISPLLGDPIEVLATLAHEMIHALRPDAGHKKAFQIIADQIGLNKPWIATTAGPALRERLNTILAELGPYPHSPLNPAMLTTRRQSTRLRLYECSCPVKVRVASDDFQATCTVCDSPFQRVP
jgi:hypothetical protein